jgi:phosphoenolpyruvate carboxylase
MEFILEDHSWPFFHPVLIQEWRDMMKQLSEVSCNEYRSIVFKHPDFVPYFHKATPVRCEEESRKSQLFKIVLFITFCPFLHSELGGLNIGSRPAKRQKDGGIETLRAIPWIFAWTQTRMHLPVWLGIGEALLDAFEKGKVLN